MKPMETVYDRSKRMGFIAGPNNRMARNRDLAEAEAGPKKPAEGEGEAPPNLHDAGETMDSCASCMNSTTAEGESGLTCAKYKCPARASDVCDDFDGEGEGAEESAADTSEGVQEDVAA